MANRKTVADFRPRAEASIVEAVEAQLVLVRTMVEQLEKRGYCIALYGNNTDARSNQYIFGAFYGALVHFAKKYFDGRERKRRRPVFVSVTLVPKVGVHWTQCINNWAVEIPDVEHFKIIHVALELVSVMHEGKVRASATQMARDKLTGYIKYWGWNLETLRLMIKVLEMPLHKHILLTGDSDAKLSNP